MVNDSEHKLANCVVKQIVYKDNPKLCLFAIKDIPPQTELRYDYGD